MRDEVRVSKIIDEMAEVRASKITATHRLFWIQLTLLLLLLPTTSCLGPYHYQAIINWGKPLSLGVSWIMRIIPSWKILRGEHQHRSNRHTGCFSLYALCFQVCPQMFCSRGCIFTLIAFVWLFSTVCFHMCPQIMCISSGIITLVAFVGLFPAVCF